MSQLLRFCTVVALAFFTSHVAFAADAKPPQNPSFIDVDEVESGTLAVGYTVFSSREGVESFDVKILGVMRNAVGPGQDLVIAELAGERFRKSGVVSGMSGSPVYVQGRLLGAIGYGLGQFTDRPLAGITPIKNMLNFEKGSAGIFPHHPIGNIKPVGLALVANGLSPETLDLFKDQLAQRGYSQLSQSAGSLGHKKSESTGLFAGGPVAAVLVDGDINLAAIGTVTYMKDNLFVGFGHPFMQGGKSQFAAADAEIITTAFSLQSALKIGQSTQIVGTIFSDRISGIGGHIGDAPQMIPIKIAVNKSSYNFRIAPLPKDLPLFTAMILVNSLIARPARELGGSIDASAKIRLKSGEEFSLRHKNSGKGTALEGDVAKNFMDELGYVLDQPFQDVTIESIDFNVKTSDVVKKDQLLSVTAPNVIRLGQQLPLSVRFQPWQETTKEIRKSFVIPSGIPAGDYQVLIADRATSIRTEIESGMISKANSFDLLLKQVRGLPDESSLCFYLQKADPSTEMSGYALSGLPITLQNLTSYVIVDDSAKHSKTVFRLGCQSMENVIAGSATGSLKILAPKERLRK